MFIETNSPAKLNLYLRILGKLSSGYHQLSSLILPLKFQDKITLKISSSSQNEIILKARLSEDLNNHLKGDSLDFKEFLESDSNLVNLACRAFIDKVKISDKNFKESLFKIELLKNIPPQAGLGGGSSNAASILSALNKHFKNILSDSELIDLARDLGSDVPAQLYLKPVIAEGRGERVKHIQFSQKSIDYISKLGVLLVKPLFGTSTKAAFNNLNLNNDLEEKLTTEESGIISVTSVDKNLFEIEPKSFFKGMKNDFDSAFSLPKENLVEFQKSPKNSKELFYFIEFGIKEFSKTKKGISQIRHILAGSGSTRAVIFECNEDLNKFYEFIKPKLPTEFMLVSTAFDTSNFNN